ncbi:MAG: hypothetical protein HY328_15215, partial [Chloroflexi bacterium]|nr:hypothetical protein [Chloroflexota bacterium]
FASGDSLIFYAQAYTDRYQDFNTCFLTWQPGVTVNPSYRAILPRTQTNDDGLPLTTRITRTLRVEQNREYRSAYALDRSADHWFDLPLLVNSTTPTATRIYTLSLTQPITADGTAWVTAHLYGGKTSGATTAQGFELLWNDAPIASGVWLGNTPYTLTVPLSAQYLQAHNQMTLLAARSAISGAESFWISPDWVALSYPALAQAQEDRLLLLPDSLPDGPARLAVTGFSASELLVYAIDDPHLPQRLVNLSAQPADSGYGLVLPVDRPGAAYALASVDALLSPRSIAVDQPSSWATPDHQADYIAIVHRLFWDAIDPLLAHRQSEGLRVAKVDVQDIYDEFNDGRLDPEAIRVFLAYAYHNWNAGGESPQYVLLVGDGHYDFKGASGTTLGNFIPPYLVAVDPWLGETAADNRYVSIGGPDDYLPAMSIGRIPANSPGDVAALVEKILAYESAPAAAEWRNRVVLVADAADDPAYNFHAVSEEMAAQLPAGYARQRIYYGPDHPDGDAMRTAIRGAFDEGALLIQWFGHASRFRWGSVSMFNSADVPFLAANSSWPVTFDYACWSGYFVNLHQDRPALAEALLLTPQRGAVAVLAPSGLHVGSALRLLNQGIVQAIFVDGVDRLGPAVDQGRLYFDANSPAWRDIIDTSILFGDPALKLALPGRGTGDGQRLYLPALFGK